jgi:hypothetical protein
MFIAGESRWCELRQEFHVLASGGLHFTPDGVSTPAALVTIYMELLTEFRADNFECPNSRASEFLRDSRHMPITDQRLPSRDVLVTSPTLNHTLAFKPGPIVELPSVPSRLSRGTQ